MLDELEGDAAEPIPVGNHNLLDSAADRAVQKGEQAPAVEVDAGRNVLNDFVLGIAGAEVEVCALLGARDAAVENASSRLCCRILRGGGGHVQGPLDVGQAVQPLAGGGPDPDAPHASGVGPAPQRGVAHPESGLDLFPGHVRLGARGGRGPALFCAFVRFISLHVLFFCPIRFRGKRLAEPRKLLWNPLVSSGTPRHPFYCAIPSPWRIIQTFAEFANVPLTV